MSGYSVVKNDIKPPIWKVFVDSLIRLPWTWRITLGYLTFMLLDILSFLKYVSTKNRR